VTTRPRPLRTLIADDSKAFAPVLEHWISDRPELVWVGTTTSGPAALEAVERLAPDLILLDAVLPGLDGFRVLRELSRLRRPPLAVLMTFDAGPAARRAALDAGASGFLAKDELAEGMEKLLPELIRGVGTGSEARRAVGAAGRRES
jgi:CheY-like chemotaxis protein